MKTKANCKKQNFEILLAFLSITITLLIAVSVYCYLIKYWSKEKHLKENVYIDKCIIKMSNKDLSMKNHT